MRFCLILGIVSVLAGVFFLSFAFRPVFDPEWLIISGTYFFNGAVWLANYRLLKQTEEDK